MEGNSGKVRFVSTAHSRKSKGATSEYASYNASDIPSTNSEFKFVQKECKLIYYVLIDMKIK